MDKETKENKIILNDMPFKAVEGANYKYDYAKIAEDIKNKKIPSIPVFRELIRNDLWFLIYFILQIPPANHPFVVQASNEVLDGDLDGTLDLWAREHFKSTVITIGFTIQRLLKCPNESIAIFSYSKDSAMVFLRQIKFILESNEILKRCFPDVLYSNPMSEAPKWSEEYGIYVKRTSQQKEASVEAWGLVKGMPTGRHFDGRIYDDIETFDMAFTPDVMMKLIDTFELSHNLGKEGGWHKVVGTPYHHEGLLMYLKKKKDSKGKPVYKLRFKPATADGTPNGEPVLLSQKRLDELKLNKKFFFSQQLLDPTPLGERALEPSYLQYILPQDIPQMIYKFLVIDPAGSSKAKSNKGDCWAITIFGVEPFLDDIGLSNVYIIDMIAEEFSHPEAMHYIVQMYLRNTPILKIGVEKVGLSTTEIHISNSLRARGIVVSKERGNLVLLSPAGRPKQVRIEQNISYPLSHGKIYINKSIPNQYLQRLELEMEKFPFWHDDILDTIAYGYDLIKNYRFSNKLNDNIMKEDRWERLFRQREEKYLNWKTV